MIENIAYQTLGDLANNSVTDFGYSISGYIGYIIFAVVFGIAASVYLRHALDAKSYVPIGERLFRVRMGIMGNYYVEGNLSKVIMPFSLETLNELSQVPTLKKVVAKGVEELKKLSKDGKLHLYYLKPTQFEDIPKLKRNMSKLLIISSAPIESSNISWQSKKEYRNWYTLSTEPIREFYTYITAEFHRVEDENHEKIDCWIVSPIPKSEIEGEFKFGYNIEDFLQKEHTLNITKLPNSKDLAMAALFIQSLIELHRVLDVKEIQLENFKDIIEEKITKSIEQTYEINDLLDENIQQKLVGKDSPTFPIRKANLYVVAVATGFVTMFATLLPLYVDSLRGFPPIFSGMIGIGIVLGGIAIYNWRKSDEQKVREQMMLQNPESASF